LNVGGILSDSYLGKFKTIIYLSFVYCLGNLVMAYVAIPTSSPSIVGLAVGLGLLALGTGGIKPCVSAFGGDQFHESDTWKLASFFSMFYFAINMGSVLSMIVTPILRSDVHW
jgi:dipeptide/tripeptide permease